MALENNRILGKKKSMMGNVRTLALIALGSIVPSSANAQNRHHRHEEPVAVSTVNNSCEVLTGTHSTSEWMSNAQELAACLDPLFAQIAALPSLTTNTPAVQREAIRIRREAIGDLVLETFVKVADAYTHALTDASDLSTNAAMNTTMQHDLPFSFAFDLRATPRALQRFSERMVVNGNAILARANQPGLRQIDRFYLIAAGMQFHFKVIQALTSDNDGIITQTSQLPVARNHSLEEWRAFSEVSVLRSRRANTQIDPGQNLPPTISNPTAAQLRAGEEALAYYIQALNGFEEQIISRSPTNTNPRVDLTNALHFAPRISYSDRDWYILSNTLSSLASALDANPDSVGSNRAELQRLRFELVLSSIEATQNAITEAVAHPQPTSQGRNESGPVSPLQFNQRRLSRSLLLTSDALPDLPRVMPSNANPAVVAEVQSALGINNTRRRANLDRIIALDHLSLEDKKRVRLVLINWITLLDGSLSAQERILQYSLRPLAHTGLRVCDPNSTLSGENLQMVRELVCQAPGTINFTNFVNIATNPSLIASFPSVLARDDGRPYGINDAATGIDLSPLGLAHIVRSSNGNFDVSPFSVAETLEEIYHSWYLLHFAQFAFERLDRDISITTHTEPLIGTIRLAHNASRTAAQALGELTATDSVSHTPITIDPISAPSVVTHLGVRQPDSTDNSAQLAFERASAARDARVRMFRIIGLSAAGAGAITLGTGWGLSAANASEAQNVPNTPANRQLHAEIEQIRSGVYHTQADVDRANQRLQAIHAQFLASVTPYQSTASTLQVVSYVGLGVMIAGGALAALAPVLAGSPPTQPSPGLVPTGGREGPHPLVPGRRTENEGSQGGQFGVSPMVNNTTVGVTASGSF